MIRISGIVAGVSVAFGAVICATSASAFEQTMIPTGKAARAQGLAVEQTLPGVELTTPSQSGNTTQTGAGIVIPGLGALGALPKLDFGLELLYGAPDSNAAGEPQGELPPDALTVYGSVKKTF
jgi:hypothetical protein